MRVFFAWVRQCALQLLRTRVVYALLIFSGVVLYLGLAVTSSASATINGELYTFSPAEGAKAGVYFLLLTGMFLSLAYGLWIVPYPHQSQRASLTFTLPVWRPVLVAAYAVGLWVLQLAQVLLFVASYAWVFGVAAIMGPDVPWQGVIASVVVQSVVFLFLSLTMALGVLTLGQAATYFAAAASCFVLLVAGAGIRMGLADSLAYGPWMERFYKLMPPVGELFFDMGAVMASGNALDGHLALWVAWVLLMGAAFTWRLGFPLLWRSPD